MILAAALLLTAAVLTYGLGKRKAYLQEHPPDPRDDVRS